MSVFKPGDRVRVHIAIADVAVVEESTPDRVWVRLPGPGRELLLIDVRYLELIPPAFRVGDVVETDKDLERLPVGTIVKGRNGAAYQRRPDGIWGSTVITALAPYPATIIYLPEDET